jgi:hypothetical protein
MDTEKYQESCVRKIKKLLDVSEDRLRTVAAFTNVKGLSDENIEEISDYFKDFQLMVQRVVQKYGNNGFTGLYDSYGEPIFNGDILISENYDGRLKVIFDKPYEGIKFYDIVEGHESLWSLDQLGKVELGMIDFRKESWIDRRKDEV